MPAVADGAVSTFTGGFDSRLASGLTSYLGLDSTAGGVAAFFFSIAASRFFSPRTGFGETGCGAGLAATAGFSTGRRSRPGETACGALTSDFALRSAVGGVVVILFAISASCMFASRAGLAASVWGDVGRAGVASGRAGGVTAP